MRSPLVTSRAKIDSWVQARARAEIARARAGGDAPSEARAEASARQALGSGELRQTLEEAISLGLLEADEHGAMLGLLSLAARDEVLARGSIGAPRASESVFVEGAPRTLAELLLLSLDEADPRARASALESIGDADDRVRAQRLEALEEASAIIAKVRARGPSAPDAGPDDLGASAARFLDATDDAARDVVARLAHGRPAPRTVLDVLVLLRAPHVDPLAPPRERPRRIAALLAPLGLEDALASRVQLDAAHAELDLEAHVVALDPPHRTVILPSSIELGLASELSFAHAIGRALASSLVAPALPLALRRAWPGSVGRAVGELVAHLHADALFVRRARGIEGTALEALRRTALALTLLRARALAARVVTEGMVGRERLERGADQLARALGVDDPTMPAALADPGTFTPEERRADLRAALHAPALALALRDRFDEDWFRNPRAAEPIRAACGRGGVLSIEEWAQELGATPERSVLRIAELAR